MALLIARAIKAGVHAHRDASDPEGPPSEITRAMRRPKASIIYDPVYDLVMSIERKARGDKKVTPFERQERPLPHLPPPPLPEHMVASSSAPATPTGLTSARPFSFSRVQSPYEARSTPGSRTNLIIDREALDRDLPPLPSAEDEVEGSEAAASVSGGRSTPNTPVPLLPPRRLTRAPSRDTLDEPPPPYPGHEVEGYEPESRRSEREPRRGPMLVANPDE
ncbi:hypothetical protein Q8F55_000336 [Vanrija albida]|uniref:Uncharacterized protein n=1 Tax=Vanrija albida TaxID=181172 RepID=A0ABR3QCZ5_9TREE